MTNPISNSTASLPPQGERLSEGAVRREAKKKPRNGKLWQKSSAMKLHPLIETYTVGDDPVLDLHLLPFDIQASKAHAQGLAKIGILKPLEAKRLIAALTKLEKEVAKGKIIIRMEDEDCHTVIEHFLIKTCGDLGKKIHTGRSRNDQVLVAIRLFLKDQLRSIRNATLTLAETFLHSAEKYRDVPFPGYSHTQQAMLSSLGHYFASFVENLLEDCEFLNAAIRHIDRNPLGSAAGFGVALPLDRNGTTKALGFSRMQLNSLACQTSRGKFESVALEADTRKIRAGYALLHLTGMQLLHRQR
jgi:argininosuccinate lyase